MNNNGMEFVLGGVAACCAGFFTNPLEVIKTRLQLQGELKSRGHYTVHYRNIFHAFYTVAKAESIFALQKGLVPALWYQFFMNGVRLGAFQCFENFGVTRNKRGDISVVRSVAAGATAGCIGAVVGSPFYMVKTQLQAQSAAAIAVGHQHHHPGMSKAFQIIYSSQGIPGLWRGVTAAMARVACGSAVQLSSFSKAKSIIDNTGVFPTNSWLNAFAAATLSGFLVVACMTPFDVVSTRLYNQAVDAQGRGLLYSGLWDCLVKITKTEGILGFYKGWSASLMRLSPHTILSLVFWSEIRKLYMSFQKDLTSLN